MKCKQMDVYACASMPKPKINFVKKRENEDNGKKTDCHKDTRSFDFVCVCVIELNSHSHAVSPITNHDQIFYYEYSNRM